jgi:RHS repeat-associated protein
MSEEAFWAARLDDPLLHTTWISDTIGAVVSSALLIGGAVGVAALTVGTGGWGGLAVMFLAGAVLQYGLGHWIESIGTSVGNYFSPPTEQAWIRTGSPDTHTNSKKSARAAGVFHHELELPKPEPDNRSFIHRTAEAVAHLFTLDTLKEMMRPTVQTADPRCDPRELDKIECEKHFPNQFLVQDSNQYLAQGSKIVFINSQPAVRSGALSTCEAKVIDTPPKVSPDVRIGGELVTVRDIRSGKYPIGLLIDALTMLLAPGKCLAKLGCMLLTGVASAVGGIVVGKVLEAAFSKHPVHLPTGAKTLGDETDLDFVVPGNVPIEWQRVYNSRDERTEGIFGAAWSVSYEVCLELSERDGVAQCTYVDDHGRRIQFDALPPGGGFYSPGEGLGIRRSPEGIWTIEDEEGVIRVFEPINETYQRLRTLSDRNGNRLILDYDNSGRLTSIADSEGASAIALTYDEHNHPRRVRRIEQLGANGERRLLATYDYDARGDLSHVYDVAGNVQRRFAYDDGRRMIGHILPTGLVCRYAWASLDGPEGPEWRVVEHWTENGNAPQESYRFAYDLKNGVTVVRDSLGRTSRRRWNPQYQITEYTDELGHTWCFDWSDERLLLGATDPQGGQWSYTYDIYGRLLTQTDPLGRVEKTEWLPHWALPTVETAPDQTTNRYVYDPSGNCVAEIDALGQRTRIDHDRHGRPIRITDPRGGLVQQRWNERGQLTDYIDCSGRQTQYLYDVYGQLHTVTDALGRSTRYRYDAVGRLRETVLPDGRIESVERTPAGLPAALVDPAGARTTYQWLADGQLARRTDPLGHHVDFSYDAYGRLVALINENREQYRFAYDDADRLIEQIDLAGLKQRFEYDTLDRPVAVSWHPQDGSAPLEHRLVRDALGRLTEKHTPDGLTRYTWLVSDALSAIAHVPAHALGKPEEPSATHTLAYEYDRLGRLIAESTPQDTLRHAYDVLGNRISTTLPDGRTLNHLYYGSGHLHQINLDGAVISDFERDHLHREVARSQGALQLDSAWDATGRLRSRAWRRKSQPRQQPAELEKRYEYDRADNLVRRLRIGSQTANPWQRNTRATELSYDAAGRIVGSNDADRRETFAWDAAANLLDAGQSRGTVRNNRIVSHGDRHYRYDSFGRMSEKRIGDRSTQHYRYDAEQRLCEVRIDRPTTTERIVFDYDPLGRRIAKRRYDEQNLPTARTDFLWDGMRLLTEHTERLPQRLYIYRNVGSYEALACVDGLNTEQIYYYQNDASGLPEELTDQEGQIVWEAQYEVWGNTVREHWVPTHRTPQNLRFQGQYLDRETGLHYNTFRYYDPDIGRFTQPDPIGLMGGLNIYQYAPNPLAWVDPWGWTPCRTVNGTNIYGKGQVTGKGHAPVSEGVANILAKSGKFREIHLHRPYKSTTGVTTTPKRSPDITAIDRNGRAHAIEVASESDMRSPGNYADLTARNQVAQGQLPASQRGQIVVIDKPYDGRVIRQQLDALTQSIP